MHPFLSWFRQFHPDLTNPIFSCKNVFKTYTCQDLARRFALLECRKVIVHDWNFPCLIKSNKQIKYNSYEYKVHYVDSLW